MQKSVHCMFAVPNQFNGQEPLRRSYYVTYAQRRSRRRPPEPICQPRTKLHTVTVKVDMGSPVLILVQRKENAQKPTVLDHATEVL